MNWMTANAFASRKRRVAGIRLPVRLRTRVLWRRRRLDMRAWSFGLVAGFGVALVGACSSNTDDGSGGFVGKATTGATSTTATSTTGAGGSTSTTGGGGGTAGSTTGASGSTGGTDTGSAGSPGTSGVGGSGGSSVDTDG